MTPECARRRRVLDHGDHGTTIDARKIGRYGEGAWLAQVCDDDEDDEQAAAEADAELDGTARAPPSLPPIRFARWTPASHELHICSYASSSSSSSSSSSTTTTSPPSCDALAVQPLPDSSGLPATFFGAALPDLQKGPVLHPTRWSMTSATPSKNIAAAASHLQANSFVALHRLLSDKALRVAANFANAIVRSGALPQHDAMTTRHHFVNDTLSRFLQVELTPLVERLANVGPLTLSHTYFAGYVLAGSRIPPHRDRPGCDISLSLNVASTPQKPAFPIGVTLAADADDAEEEAASTRGDAIVAYEFGASGWLEVRDGLLPTDDSVDAFTNIVEVWLEPGDAFLFWGRKLEHFRRRPLPAGEQSLNILLHWGASSDLE